MDVNNLKDDNFYNEEIKQENEVFGNIINKFETSPKIPDVTMEELAKEFNKFKGNYMEVIQQFPNMLERDQKLFILYSVFYFGLKFYRENISNIMTEEVLRETSKLATDFAKYGSHTGCDINCCFNIYGPSLIGLGYNVSVPLESKTCIRNIDFLSIMDLSNFANSGYSAENEEEEIIQSLNEKRNKELFAFKELLSTLIKSKNR